MDTLQSMIEGDRVDFRCMMAREVWKERAHRVYAEGEADVSPAVFVQYYGDSLLREELEIENGEPLA